MYRVLRIIKKVSRSLASLYHHHHIKFPATNRILDVQRAFMQQRGIPGVVGLMDCTQIPIISPGGDNAELFRNRKGHFSINIQAICDHELKLIFAGLAVPIIVEFLKIIIFVQSLSAGK
jgi:hypothetical protein